LWATPSTAPIKEGRKRAIIDRKRRPENGSLARRSVKRSAGKPPRSIPWSHRFQRLWRVIGPKVTGGEQFRCHIIPTSTEKWPLTIVVSAKRIRGRAIVFKNILVPTDGSELAVKAVEQSVLFAREAGAKITAVTVTEPYPLAAVTASKPDAPLEYKKLAEAHAEKVLDAVSVAARQAGVTCETLRMERAQVYQAISMPLPPGGAI